MITFIKGNPLPSWLAIASLKTYQEHIGNLSDNNCCLSDILEYNHYWLEWVKYMIPDQHTNVARDPRIYSLLAGNHIVHENYIHKTILLSAP